MKVKVKRLGAMLGVGLIVAVVGSYTVANERWDGLSVCVDHKTRNLTAASSNKCQSGSTLRTMGLEGMDGRDGSQILNGTGLPNSEIGAIGDYYLDSQSARLFGPKSEEGWGNGTSLRGPQGGSGGSGSTGPAGPAGPQGAVGPAGPATGYRFGSDSVSIASTDAELVFSTAADPDPAIVIEPGDYIYVMSAVGIPRNNRPLTPGHCTIFLNGVGISGPQHGGGTLIGQRLDFGTTSTLTVQEDDVLEVYCNSSQNYGPWNAMFTPAFFEPAPETYRVSLSLIRMDDLTTWEFMP
jgi:hypothetical protein